MKEDLLKNGFKWSLKKYEYFSDLEIWLYHQKIWIQEVSDNLSEADIDDLAISLINNWKEQNGTGASV